MLVIELRDRACPQARRDGGRVGSRRLGCVGDVADSEGTLLDRWVEFVDEGLPTLPHHHEGQKLPLQAAVALVARVRASAERNALDRHSESTKQAAQRDST
jgi:hypothetical protein